jgi:hypothetical protein
MSGIGILIRRMRRVLVFSQPAGLVHMGFLKPRLLRCLGLRPRRIPGDDSSCFTVGADQDVRHGSDGYSTTARTREPSAHEPIRHTPTRPHHPEQGNLDVLRGVVTVCNSAAR